jgi:hypothetical protein
MSPGRLGSIPHVAKISAKKIHDGLISFNSRSVAPQPSVHRFLNPLALSVDGNTN